MFNFFIIHKAINNFLFPKEEQSTAEKEGWDSTYEYSSTLVEYDKFDKNLNIFNKCGISCSGLLMNWEQKNG
jgi:hypothetical protein